MTRANPRNKRYNVPFTPQEEAKILELWQDFGSTSIASRLRLPQGQVAKFLKDRGLIRTREEAMRVMSERIKRENEINLGGVNTA